jgi:hypothetical protein
MRNTRKLTLLAVLGIVVTSVPLFAHHGNVGYDNRTLVVKGTVTAWLWTNPHTFLKFDTTDDKGAVTHWIAEWNAPGSLINYGVTAHSFRTGDEVTVTMTGISKVSPNVGRIAKVLLPNGQELAEVGRGAGVPGRNADDKDNNDK